jgi:hypothetical protein
LGLPPLVNPYPALNLDFINNPLDPRITFTRATTATFFNSSGVLSTAASGEARFDYNPSTLAAQGLLIEEQRTNLCLQSADFGTTWTALNATVSTNTSVAPDGTTSADTITPAASSAAHLVSQSVTVSASVGYVASVFVKSDGAPFVQVVYDNGASVGAFMNVNLSTGAITRGAEAAGGATNVVGTVSNVGNGFYRIAVGATHTGTTGRVLISPLPAGQSTAGLNPTTTTAATDKIIVWGAQLEAGAFATSYIPTTTTALTRNADAASMTGTNFSSWYNQSSGSMFVEFSLSQPASGGNQFLVRASDNSYNNAVVDNVTSTGFVQLITASGGVFDGNASAAVAVSANTNTKFCGAYATNDLAACKDGGAVATDSSATIPTGLTRFDIGSDHAGLNRVKAGYIRRIAYYPVRLPNSTLQALTA